MCEPPLPTVAGISSTCRLVGRRRSFRRPQFDTTVGVLFFVDHVCLQYSDTVDLDLQLIAGLEP